jgi:patatin-like phospholipase/acyl hydrolase
MENVATDTHREPAQRFQILSLDGGGIRGLFSAAVLAAIEDDLSVKIQDHFDLLAGTSTGGIIALALGLGMRPRQVVELYLGQGRRIFPKWFGAKWVQHWLLRKYNPKPLEVALKNAFKRDDQGQSKQARLGDSTKRLVIPAYNLGEDDVYLFRTPHHPHLKADFKVPAWKVGMATAAAPTYFPCHRGVNSLRLIDGGVWANNPALVAIVEATATLRVPLTAVRVLSIGTSNVVSHRRGRLNWGGILPWAVGNAATDLILRGQSIGVNNHARLLLGKDGLERIDPLAAAGEFSLDGAEKADDLIGRAAHYTRRFTPRFEELFRKHLAPEYKPIYA